MLINFKSAANLDEISNQSLKVECKQLLSEINVVLDVLRKDSVDEAIDLLCNLSEKVEQVATQLLDLNHVLAASFLLGEFVEAQPWFEADYGSADGFWYEHTQLVNKLFDLGKSLPREIIPEVFDPNTSYFTLNVGIALNEKLTVDDVVNLIPSAAEYGHISEEEDAIVLSALMLNKAVNREVAYHIVPQFNEVQAATVCALITGIYYIYGCSTQSVQFAAYCESFSVEMLQCLDELACASPKVFNEQVNWQDLQVDRDTVRAEIRKRIDF